MPVMKKILFSKRPRGYIIFRTTSDNKLYYKHGIHNLSDIPLTNDGYTEFDYSWYKNTYAPDIGSSITFYYYKDHIYMIICGNYMINKNHKHIFIWKLNIHTNILENSWVSFATYIASSDSTGYFRPSILKLGSNQIYYSRADNNGNPKVKIYCCDLDTETTVSKDVNLNSGTFINTFYGGPNWKSFSNATGYGITWYNGTDWAPYIDIYSKLGGNNCIYMYLDTSDNFYALRLNPAADGGIFYKKDNTGVETTINDTSIIHINNANIYTVYTVHDNKHYVFGFESTLDDSITRLYEIDWDNHNIILVATGTYSEMLSDYRTIATMNNNLYCWTNNILKKFNWDTYQMETIADPHAGTLYWNYDKFLLTDKFLHVNGLTSDVNTYISDTNQSILPFTGSSFSICKL